MLRQPFFFDCYNMFWIEQIWRCEWTTPCHLLHGFPPKPEQAQFCSIKNVYFFALISTMLESKFEQLPIPILNRIMSFCSIPSDLKDQLTGVRTVYMEYGCYPCLNCFRGDCFIHSTGSQIGYAEMMDISQVVYNDRCLGRFKRYSPPAEEEEEYSPEFVIEPDWDGPDGLSW